MRPHAAAAALFLVLAVVMTWPLARNLDSAVAWPGDPFINIWILDWDWWATFHQPLSLFDANAFYPARHSLAYSENLYGIAVFLFPFRAAGVPPIAAYNLAMLLGYAFSGFGAYVLAFSVTPSVSEGPGGVGGATRPDLRAAPSPRPLATLGVTWWAGVAGGIFYAFVPFRITHAAHVQHVWAGWLPILIVALLHYAKRPTWPRAALFGAAFLLNGLANIHWLLFGTVAIAVTALIVRPRIVPLATCTLAAALLLAPFLIPYESAARQYKMQRTWQETKSFSAEPRDWLVAAGSSRWYGALADAKVDPERWLFPGALAILFSAMAVVAGWRPSPPLRGPSPRAAGRGRLEDPSPREAGRGWRAAPGEGRHSRFIGLAWLLLGIAGSLGTHLFFHRFLFTYVPGFKAIRVPARWANIAYVGMALLIALGVRAIARDRRWVAAIIAGAFAVELCAAPILWYLAVPANPPVYQWMRSSVTPSVSEGPGGTGGAQTRPPRSLATLGMTRAVLELPVGQGLDYAYMLRATAHHRPIVNGTSGFTPPETLRIEALAHAHSDALIPELRRIGVDHVVVHGDYVGEPTRRWLSRELDLGRIGFVRRFDNGISGDWLFTTTGPPRRTPVLDAFLAGQPTVNSDTFGYLDQPLPGQRIGPRGAYFSGVALSPYGVRSVTLLLQNGRVRVTPFLFDDAALRRRFPWYAATTKPRFIRELARRPDGVAERTDVQVEIIDGRGQRVLLEDRFFVWPRGD